MISFLGSGKNKKDSKEKTAPVFWELDILENAFRFFTACGQEYLVEHDELAAIGAAYHDWKPVNIFELLNRLEKLVPYFQYIQLAADLRLIRKRQAHSPGLLIDEDDRPFSNQT